MNQPWGLLGHKVFVFLRWSNVAFGVFWLLMYVYAYIRAIIWDRKYRLKVETHDEIVVNIKNYMKRPVGTTPIHIDLPRLCRRIIVFERNEVAGGGLVDDIESATTDSKDPRSRQEVVYDIMVSTARVLGELDVRDLFISKRPKFLGSSTDLLSNTLMAILRDVPRDSRAISVLKACNQSAIAPVIVDFKRRLAGIIPHRDINCTWQIHVSLFREKQKDDIESYVGDIEYVHRVHHRKRSQAPDLKYHFDWNVVFLFRGDISCAGFCAFVTDTWFADDVSLPERHMMQELFDKYSAEHSAFVMPVTTTTTSNK